MRNLSIIIPHYSKHKALQQTLDELILQLHSNDEILIVDDYSPEGAPEYDCPCTKTIQPPKHIPLPPKYENHIYRLNTLRNYGIKHAKHDPILILDPDCLPSLNLLDHARKIYDPSVLFAGWIWYINKDGNAQKEKRQTGETTLGKSMWIDRKNRDCIKVLGGCMFFSRKRAVLVGLFNTRFDGAWGWEEHEFASACRNSGMRLRFEAKLMVRHQWHESSRAGSSAGNRRLMFMKIAEHRNSLNVITPYDPAIVVLMVSPMSPHYVDQRMRAVFRHDIPLKVRLVNNGDQSEKQLSAMSWWSDRWAVDYVDYKTPQPLSIIRSDAVRDYGEKGYKYLVTIEGDVMPMSGSIITLISEIEENPQYHVLSGYTVDEKGEKGDNKDSSQFQITRLNETTSSQDAVKIGVTEKAGSYHQPPLATSKVKPKNTSNHVSSSAELDKAFEGYKNARQRDREEGCLVTIIMPTVARPGITKKTIVGIVKYANFPHIFKAIIHPDQTELIMWAEKLGIEVIPKFYSPIVKAKAATVQLCQTKYLLMFDNDLVPMKPMKPMLDFMENHQDVGICAAAIEGHPRHKLMHYGANLWVDEKRYLKTTALNKGTQDYQYCNYVHHGATMFRMEVFEDVKYDVCFPGQGYEHEDLFLQLRDTPWKIVNYNAVSVLPLIVKAPEWYGKLRGVKVRDSRKYLFKKWSLMGLG